MRPLRHLLIALLALAACRKEPVRPAPPPSDRPAPPPAPAQAPARGSEHAVFSLVDNRLLAHVERGGALVALPGSPAFAKYMRFGRPKLGWKTHQKKDDRLVGIADLYAPLQVPLTEEQAHATSIHVRLDNPAPRRMTVMVNGKQAGTLALVAGWQTVSTAVAPGLLTTGENELQLAFAKGEPAAVEWIQVGGDPPGDAAVSVYDPAQRALVLAENTALVYYVAIPKDGRLVADVNGAGCSVDVDARAHEGGKVTGKLAGAGSAVELGALAGKVARLRLAPSGCKLALLPSAALAVPGPAATVTKGVKPKHIVLWIMDSLRADRVKPFWPKARPEVPTFNSLATKGTVFRNTYVQGNESRASHASIWSAVYAGTHRVIVAGAKLDTAKFTTLGEAMKAAGFYTSGVSSNGYITPKLGFGEGWDAYRNNIHEGGGVRAEDVLKYGIASVDKKTADPWFLYLGTVDTHVSWRAKEPWFAKYDPKPYSGKFQKEASGQDVEKMATGKLKIDDRDKERIIAIYDSNVSYQDDQLGKLLEQLKTWGIADSTLVVVTADHGDEQWEDGRVGHGGSLRESLIRVPLVVYYPPLFPAVTVEEGAETIDILPTLIDVMGGKQPAEAQGESLIPLAQGVERGYPRPSIASQYETAHAMRLFNWKARVAGSGVPTIFHVEEDPYEKQDLATTRPLERRFLTDALSTFLVYQKDWKKSRWGVASNMSPQAAADLEKATP